MREPHVGEACQVSLAARRLDATADARRGGHATRAMCAPVLHPTVHDAEERGFSLINFAQC